MEATKLIKKQLPGAKVYTYIPYMHTHTYVHTQTRAHMHMHMVEFMLVTKHIKALHTDICTQGTKGREQGDMNKSC